jgi:orotidine-5'-phosphate decarboxylase
MPADTPSAALTMPAVDRKDRLIVALDVESRGEAEAMIEALGDDAGFFKIGYQLFYGGDGYNLGKDLIRAGKKVFFDLKLLDIDNTVEKGVAAIADTGAHMLTVHAYPNAMHAAVKGAEGSDLCLLGVTVLTSMDEADLNLAGYSQTPEELVTKRAFQAMEAGMGGIVCSPVEARRARAGTGPGLAIVTPGIRPAGAKADDQKRIATPEMAFDRGASHIVVGRPITAASDPAAAARAIIESIPE